jgi:hypothetical protein
VPFLLGFRDPRAIVTCGVPPQAASYRSWKDGQRVHRRSVSSM